MGPQLVIYLLGPGDPNPWGPPGKGTGKKSSTKVILNLYPNNLMNEPTVS